MERVSGTSVVARGGSEMAREPRRLRRVGLKALGLAGGALGFVALLASPASAATIASTGPLTSITVTPDLNCAVNHTGDAQPEFFAGTACATLVAVGGTLYGPANIPAGSSASPRTTYTLVSQTPVTGTGTGADPFKVVTVVDLGTSGIRLTETDTYVVGQETYRTDVMLTNSGPNPLNAIVYRAGDCFLQSSDSGYGLLGPAPGAVACTTMPPPNTGGRIEQWLPITPGSHYMEAGYNSVWARIGTRTDFPDTCTCGSFLDNGAGLSWAKAVPAGGSTTVSSIITFSPTGVAPLSVTKTADNPAPSSGAADGYTITVSNSNQQVVTLNSITDTLPAGFTYTSGSTTGVTTANPTVSGQQLTWSGPFAVAPGGSIVLHFGVTVATAPGTYFNNATADAGTNTVAPTGDTAPVTITQVRPTIATQATPTVTVTPSSTPPISDTATISGGNSPTGSVTFRVYGPNDATCSGTPAFTSVNPVVGGVATSNPFPTAAVGTYRWTASYSGDANNVSVSSPCNAPNESSVVTTVCAAPPAVGTPIPGYNVIVAQPGVNTVGTAGNDVIYGTSGDDRIAGLGGDDLIFGMGGNDQISGGDGNDTLCGGDGRDFLSGGNGNDLLSGDAGDDDLSGGLGDDRLYGGPGIDRLSGGEGIDSCSTGGDVGDQAAPAPSCEVTLQPS